MDHSIGFIVIQNCRINQKSEFKKRSIKINAEKCSKMIVYKDHLFIIPYTFFLPGNLNTELITLLKSEQESNSQIWWRE